MQNASSLGFHISFRRNWKSNFINIYWFWFSIQFQTTSKKYPTCLAATVNICKFFSLQPSFTVQSKKLQNDNSEMKLKKEKSATERERRRKNGFANIHQKRTITFRWAASFLKYIQKLNEIAVSLLHFAKFVSWCRQ